MTGVRLALRLLPNLQWAMQGGIGKILVGRQRAKLVTDAKLSQQRIDRSDLNAGPAAGVAVHGGEGVDDLLDDRDASHA